MINLPDLDDLSYASLVEEARAAIPALSPRWTDHNPSDPGILLLELLAWLTEMVGYRLNRIPPASYRTLLSLLNPPDRKLPEDPAEAIRQTLLELRDRHRAVTLEDYEYLVRERWPDEPAAAAGPGVRRVRAVADLNLEGSADSPAPGHVSIVVVPDVAGPSAGAKVLRPRFSVMTAQAGPAPGGQGLPQAPPELLAGVRTFLEPRRLLTAQPHAVGPQYLALTASATLYLRPDALAADVKLQAASTLQEALHPLTGGPDGNGWPFGRSLYVSDVINVLRTIPGVDFVGVAGEPVPQDGPVAGVQLRSPATPARQLPDGCIQLRSYELPNIQVTGASFTTMDFVGGQWRPT